MVAFSGMDVKHRVPISWQGSHVVLTWIDVVLGAVRASKEIDHAAQKGNSISSARSSFFVAPSETGSPTASRMNATNAATYCF